MVEIDRGTPLIDIANRATPTGPARHSSSAGTAAPGWAGALRDAVRVAVAPCHRGHRRCRRHHRARPRRLRARGVGPHRALSGRPERRASAAPASTGCPAIADDLTRLTRGQVDLALMPGSTGGSGSRRPGGCRHPDGAVQLVRSALRVFAADVRVHAEGAPCAHVMARLSCGSHHCSGPVADVIRVVIDPVACDAYGFCAELLPEAITLDEWGYPDRRRCAPAGRADRGRPARRPGLPPPRHHPARAQSPQLISAWPGPEVPAAADDRPALSSLSGAARMGAPRPLPRTDVIV